MRFLPISVLLFAATLMAQQPPARGPRQGAGPGLEALKTYLALNDAQVAQIADLQKKFRESAQPVFAQIGDKAKALRDARQANDTATATKLQADIADLRKQVDALQKAAGAQERALLDPTQTAKLQVLQKAAELEPAIRGAAAIGLIDGPGPFAGRMGGPGPGMGGMGPGMGRRGPGNN